MATTNERPILFSTPMVQAIIDGRKTQTRRTIKYYVSDQHPLRQTAKWMKDNNTCPYGHIGDVLWVRESFLKGYFDDGTHGYKADWNETAAEYVKEHKWKPSIHMPKDAARIWLKITDIRVERLQDISEKDAIAEGVESKIIDGQKFYFNYLVNMTCLDNPYFSFFSLWDKINGYESMESNPFVWVVEFEVLSKNGKPSNL